ncbi:hypothetical protein BSP10_023 [Bacillus phage BSP10]|nr:hypothetical protein BSP10_023 [Bacillus phage BSP10]QRI44753.1 HTH homing endonuclease [Bacillus phage BSTP3]
MAIEDELIGRTFCNNNGQEYQVLYVSGKKSNSTKLFRIRFIATGYERDVKMVDHKREYTVWSGMLERCYDSSCERYKDYGGAGVTVCDRWHSFENFLEDLPNIEGYDEELFKQSKIFIDKDIKQKNSPKNKKVYSPDTCCFVSRQVNNANRDLTNASNHFIATSPDGEVIYARGLRPFSKKYRLHRTSIQKCLRGEREDYNGWTFKLIKESNYKKKKAEEN